jgi:hypothetical protein
MINRSSLYTFFFFLALFSVSSLKNFKLNAFKIEYLKFYYLSLFDIFEYKNIKY